MDFDTKNFYSVLVAFVAAYLLTFPTGWLVSDVYSYMNQAIAITQGEKILTYTDAVTSQRIPYGYTPYALGNAFWIALWTKFLGIKYVYLGSLIAVALSALLIFRTLRRENLLALSSLLLFCYIPLAFFSRTLMTCIPSLLLVSVFLYSLFRYEESAKKWFFLSFLAALSFWFRETNIVLLGTICLVHFIQHKKWFLHYASGAIIGFVPRILSSYHYYEDPFHFVLAETFSLASAVQNIGVYSIILLGFMPLGAIFIAKYRGRYTHPILLSSIFFIVTYIFYGFNATLYSGFNKGLILMGRFMVPILPLFILSAAWYFKDLKLQKAAKMASAVFIVLLLSLMQMTVSKEARIHKTASDNIYKKIGNNLVMIDLSRTTNVIRYVNPFHGPTAGLSDVSNLQDDRYMKLLFDKFEKALIVQTINTANSQKATLTASISDILDKAREKYDILEIETTTINPALSLSLLEVRPKKQQMDVD